MTLEELRAEMVRRGCNSGSARSSGVAVLRAMMMSLMETRRITRKIFALTVDRFAAEGGVERAMKDPKKVVQAWLTAKILDYLKKEGYVHD